MTTKNTHSHNRLHQINSYETWQMIGYIGFYLSDQLRDFKMVSKPSNERQLLRINKHFIYWKVVFCCGCVGDKAVSEKLNTIMCVLTHVVLGIVATNCRVCRQCQNCITNTIGWNSQNFEVNFEIGDFCWHISWNILTFKIKSIGKTLQLYI